VERVRGLGWKVANADVAVVTERPRIADHRDAMRAVLAGALGLSPADVSVKGKTNEGLGWIGRGEGLACLAVVTLARH
jgi:2-C-methyl-D-erythritol 2,4-cyclodiphosphate synthase